MLEVLFNPLVPETECAVGRGGERERVGVVEGVGGERWDGLRIAQW